MFTKKYTKITVIVILLVCLVVGNELLRVQDLTKAEALEPAKPKVVELVESRDKTEAQIQELQKQKEEAEKKLQEEEEKLKLQNEEIKKEVRVSASSSSLGVEEVDKNEEAPQAVEQAKVISFAPETVSYAPHSLLDRDFLLNNKKTIKGKEIVDHVLANSNGAKFYNAFKEVHGEEVAMKAAIVLFYENGTLLETTTGVCTEKYQIGGDYRRCVYSDLNSAGMDAGLNQVNTFYQKARIARLSGIDCQIGNSRDIADPCTAQFVDWLHNVDNNIQISLNIYGEQGFKPWVGAKRAGIQ